MFNKKTILQQVMRPKDWVMLGILIIVSAVCWVWVYQAYSEPFDSNQVIDKTVFLE